MLNILVFSGAEHKIMKDNCAHKRQRVLFSPHLALTFHCYM